jgi:hypothetical protein
MNVPHSLFGMMAGCLSAVCLLPYIVSTIQGKSKPHRVTWWILSGVGFLLTANQFFAGGGSTIWLTLFAAIGQFILAILSIRFGEGKWSHLDRISIAGALLSIIIWQKFNSPLLALCLSITTDFLGCLPTIHKARRAPETENFTSWTLYFIASSLNLLAIESWTLAQVILPGYMFLANGAIFGFLFRSRLLQVPIIAKTYGEFKIRLARSSQLPRPLQQTLHRIEQRFCTSAAYHYVRSILIEERYHFERFSNHPTQLQQQTPLRSNRRHQRQHRQKNIKPEYNYSIEWR